MIRRDDFAPDAMDIRDAVIAGGFKTEHGPDGADYTGISLHPVPHWHDLLAQVMGNEILPKLSFFRINLAGELPHSWVHSDDICASHASVLYLNPADQCQGGTAFWRHDALQLDHLPSKAELAARGGPVYAEWFYAMMTREWKDLTFWKQTGFVPMQFNRLITYPTCLFHSRYPFEGFGKDKNDGRLVWVCFFDLKGQQ